MGCETPEKVLFNTLLQHVDQHTDNSVDYYIFASENVTSPSRKDIVLIRSKEMVLHEDHPLIVCKKKQSSLYLGLQALAKGQLDGFVTAGSTAGLVVLSKHLIPLLPTIERPALLATMPTKKKPIAVVDIGANVPAKSRALLQFAHLGAAYQISRGRLYPKIGLLNIGSEAVKGTLEMQNAYALLQTISEKNFIFSGNVEAKEVFNGDVDVLITEGFVGNIFLKTAEGIANFILDKLERSSSSSVLFLEELKKYLHYGKYPGAFLIGLEKPVIKCHGYSSAEAFITGVNAAIMDIKEKLCEKIKKNLTT